MPSLAAVGGSAVIVAFAVLMSFVLAYGFYARRGSGIDEHPSDGTDGAPGSQGPGEASKGRASEGTDADGRTGGTFSTHGTG